MLAVLSFAGCAAAALGVVQALVTAGFRIRVGAVLPEVAMLGTAQNLVSVALSFLAAAGAAAVLRGWAAWPAGGAAAAPVYLMAETAEMVLAELLQRRRGDPEAEDDQQGG